MCQKRCSDMRVFCFDVAHQKQNRIRGFILFQKCFVFQKYFKNEQIIK